MEHGIFNLKERIQSGETIIGVSLPPENAVTYLDEISREKYYNFVAIDSQHRPINEEKLVDFCNKSNFLGIPVQLRIKHRKEYFLIGNILDLGVSLIEVPQVENISNVKNSSSEMNYPNQGRRSWGGNSRVCIEKFSDKFEYRNWWNQKSILWAQLESINAINNALNYAENGANIVSWGPNDLAFNIESNPYNSLKNDDDCVNNVLNQLSNSKTKLCMRTYGEKDITKYKSMGVSVFLDETILVN